MSIFCKRTIKTVIPAGILNDSGSQEDIKIDDILKNTGADCIGDVIEIQIPMSYRIKYTLRKLLPMVAALLIAAVFVRNYE